jgi:hypothetical protein
MTALFTTSTAAGRAPLAPKGPQQPIGALASFVTGPTPVSESNRFVQVMSSLGARDDWLKRSPAEGEAVTRVRATVAAWPYPESLLACQPVPVGVRDGLGAVS